MDVRSPAGATSSGPEFSPFVTRVTGVFRGRAHLVCCTQQHPAIGAFPRMTNYATLNATAEDYADNRGVMLPKISLAQYGATFANWFGADPAATFANLGAFGNATDLGFLA